MGSAYNDKAGNPELAEAKRYIKTGGNAIISRSYFKETHEIENTEMESKGLYSFEQLVRIAFIQAMKDDFILGRQDGFIDYVEGLTKHYEASLIENWSPYHSANRIFDFLMSFFNLYSFQWKRHGRASDKTLHKYLEITRECLDFGYIKISEKFESLPKEIKNTVNKTFFLINGRIDEWHNEKILEIPAA
ncbi:MAG: hypothetical protein HY779_00390 [Rubrobacteridae bacterium]|nr:hypothetical protein [Rubrobacteridae bacterium]